MLIFGDNIIISWQGINKFETLCTDIYSVCVQSCIHFGHKLMLLLRKESANMYHGVNSVGGDCELCDLGIRRCNFNDSANTMAL
jgi:NAD-dependent dihydropyrimidine dehydrogenase PreA subunit